MTNAEFVSRVRNGLNSINKDSRVPNRYILHVGRQKSEFLLSQKLKDRSLYREDNLYSEIPCFEMKQIEPIKCDIIEFRSCKNLMKSVNKLPKLIYSKYGASLKEVLSLDGETEFKYTTPAQYRRDRYRDKSDFGYYYIKNNDLYLIDSRVERVNLYILTLEKENIKECDCGEDCKSLWEYEFVTSNKLTEVVIAETIKEVSLKLQIPTDENPNLNSNEKV